MLSCCDVQVENWINRNGLDATTRLFMEYEYSEVLDKTTNVYAGIYYIAWLTYLTHTCKIQNLDINKTILNSIRVPYYQVYVLLINNYLYFQIEPINSLAEVQHLEYCKLLKLYKGDNYIEYLSESDWYLWLFYIRNGNLEYRYMYQSQKYDIDVNDASLIIDIVANRHRDFDKDWSMTDIDAIVYKEGKTDEFICLEFKYSYARLNAKQDALYRYIIDNSSGIIINGYRVKYNMNEYNEFYNITMDRDYSLGDKVLYLETYSTENQLINHLMCGV